MKDVVEMIDLRSVINLDDPSLSTKRQGEIAFSGSLSESIETFCESVCLQYQQQLLMIRREMDKEKVKKFVVMI